MPKKPTLPNLPDKYQVYRTERGIQLCADSCEILRQLEHELVDLIMTSPPFALQRKKSYGNKGQRKGKGSRNC